MIIRPSFACHCVKLDVQGTSNYLGGHFRVSARERVLIESVSMIIPARERSALTLPLVQKAQMLLTEDRVGLFIIGMSITIRISIAEHCHGTGSCGSCGPR